MALFDEGLIKAACADGDADAIRALSNSIRVRLRDRAALGPAPVRAGGGLGDMTRLTSPIECCGPVSVRQSRRPKS